MSFEPAGNFLMLAAQKYRLGDQALASMVCRRAEKIFSQRFPHFLDFWQPNKFEDGKLYIHVRNSSAGSELFLRTHEILEIFDQENFPARITEIRIVRR